jgi:hypothetical protein
MNVCLIVDTQSYNVKSLGLAEDANIRANLNILCQGYVWQDEEGIDRGDYAMIENLLKNRYLVQDATLAQNFDRLVAESQKQQTPIIFTTIGRQPRLELLPDLRKYKQQLQEFKQAPIVEPPTHQPRSLHPPLKRKAPMSRSVRGSDRKPTPPTIEQSKVAWEQSQRRFHVNGGDQGAHPKHRRLAGL